MGKVKNLEVVLGETLELLAQLAKDIHDIAEYIKDKQKKENTTLLKKNRNERNTWRKLI